MSRAIRSWLQAPGRRYLLAALLLLLWGLGLRLWPQGAPGSQLADMQQRRQHDIDRVQHQAAPGPDGLRLSWLPVASVKPGVPGGLLRFGELRPQAQPQVDVLFLHGHADRLDNHMALFRAWQHSGARVIALDWPSHGGSHIGPLDMYEAEDLFALVQLVERATLQDPQRPLVLAGWSYGGLIATRLLQHSDALQGLSRRPAGLLLLAPGVVLQPFVGGDGIARVETLMHAPYTPLAGPPSPASPLLNPVFALRTLVLAQLAQQALLPSDIPVQVIVGDARNDWYVNTQGVIDWSRRQQAGGVPLQLLQCPDARHALDTEPWPLGQRVRELGVQFVQRVGGAGWPPAIDAATATPTPQDSCTALPALGLAGGAAP